MTEDQEKNVSIQLISLASRDSALEQGAVYSGNSFHSINIPSE